MPQNDRGFLMKTYGGKAPSKKYPLSDKNAEAWPELEQQLASIATNEMPNEVKSTKSIRPMNFIDKYLLPKEADAAAYPWPLNSIVINKDRMTSPHQLKQTLAHELTHIDQFERRPTLLGKFLELVKPRANYFEDPDEGEAFQKELFINRRTGRDINLPVEKKKK